MPSGRGKHRAWSIRFQVTDNICFLSISWTCYLALVYVTLAVRIFARAVVLSGRGEALAGDEGATIWWAPDTVEPSPTMEDPTGWNQEPLTPVLSSSSIKRFLSVVGELWGLASVNPAPAPPELPSLSLWRQNKSRKNRKIVRRCVGKFYLKSSTSWRNEMTRRNTQYGGGIQQKQYLLRRSCYLGGWIWCFTV